MRTEPEPAPPQSQYLRRTRSPSSSLSGSRLFESASLRARSDESEEKQKKQKKREEHEEGEEHEEHEEHEGNL